MTRSTPGWRTFPELALMLLGVVGIVGSLGPWSHGRERAAFFGSESDFAYRGVDGALGLVSLGALAVALLFLAVAPHARLRAGGALALFAAALASAALAWANGGRPVFLALSEVVSAQVGWGLHVVLLATGAGAVLALRLLVAGVRLERGGPPAQVALVLRRAALAAAALAAVGSVGPWYETSWTEQGEYHVESLRGIEGARGLVAAGTGAILVLLLARPRGGHANAAAALGFVLLMLLLAWGPYPLEGAPPPLPDAPSRGSEPGWGYLLVAAASVLGVMTSLLLAAPVHARVEAPPTIVQPDPRHL